MNDDTLNSNFEWKKKGFGKREKLSRRIDAKQAFASKLKQKNDFTGSISLTAQPAVSFNHHLKKMRKTIKQALDEEEDDDENENVFFQDPVLLLFESELDTNPLYNGLDETEKNLITQKRTIEQIKMQHDASKITALTKVNHFAQKAGLDPLTAGEMAGHMQNNAWGDDAFKLAIENQITPHIKVDAKLDAKKIHQLMKGLKRLQKMGDISAADGMKMNDVIKITDNKFNDEKVAQMLLRKTGRNIEHIEKKRNSRQPQKVSFKKLVQQKQHKKQNLRELS